MFYEQFVQQSNEIVAVDKLLLQTIMLEVATFLLDLDCITEPAVQRIASIALRQIDNGSVYSISHDQLVRRIRNLNTDDQDIFLEELKRLLVNMMSAMTVKSQQPRVESAMSVDELGVCLESHPPCNLQSTERNEIGLVLEEGESSADDQTKNDENEDLAEADQRCCSAEDEGRSASDTHSVC